MPEIYVYINFFYTEETDLASNTLEKLEDSRIMAWYACLQDVLPVLTGFECTIPVHTSITAFTKFACKSSEGLNN